MKTPQLFSLLFITTVSIGQVFTKPFADEPVCGYKACPLLDPNVLNVHLIPHSHDDVGWKKTYEQYYFQDVQNVISSVVQALKQNSARRFIQVETAYFKKWWEVQPASIQEDVIKLANNGQFEVINAAWSMNDEAGVHYQSTIDQYTFGLRYMEDALGKCARTKVAWQIDPFGHSREQASLSAQMGFDSLFFGRIDYRDKNNRKQNKKMEIIWQGSENLGNTSNIFTSIFSNHYHAPNGFCFDISCGDEPIIDDEESPDFNWEKRVKDFTKFIESEAEIYATNHILTTLGGDMQYQAALNAYINYDRLIEGFKRYPQKVKGLNVNIFYSTPTCYTKAVNEFVNKNNVSLEIKTDDFFPHADNANTYWSGYFTSRPASKYYERVANNLVQIGKQLDFALNGTDATPSLRTLKDALGVLQHHDAITGTEKQHVTNNYHLSIAEGIDAVSNFSATVLTKIITGNLNTSNNFEFLSCTLTNITACSQTDASQFTVVVYNPLSRVVSSPISLPVDGKRTWFIMDDEAKEVDHDVVTSITDFSYASVNNIKTTNASLEFIATDLPALGYKLYQIQAAGGKRQPIILEAVPEINGYEDTNFEIDSKTGLLNSVTMNGLTVDLKQDFLYYTSKDQSGAYIFVPTNTTPERIAKDAVKVSAFNGNVSRGVVQEFGDWAKQTIRVYEYDQSFIEFDWIIGPIDISDKKGKEIITQYTTSLHNDGIFSTDSNGREMLQRKVNSRLGYNYTNEQPIAGNYYPINTKVLISDEMHDIEVAILTDRSEGGSSINEGQIEVMVHRACQHDDGKGVDESLNEQEYEQGIIIRGRHQLVLGPKNGNGKKSLAAIQRELALKRHLAPWSFIANKNADLELLNRKFSILTRPLADNVNLLTLEPWGESKFLIRIEHILEKDEDSELSKDATVDLTDLFVNHSIVDLQETTLAGNWLIEDNVRLAWPGSEMDEIHYDKLKAKKNSADLKFTLAAMQIRTFVATTEYHTK